MIMMTNAGQVHPEGMQMMGQQPMMMGQQPMMMQQQPMMMQQQPMMMQQQPMMMQQQPMMMGQQPMMMQQQPMMMQQQPMMMQQQQQPMMMQQQQMMMQPGMVQPMLMQAPQGQIIYLTPENPWGSLESCNSIVIEQELELLEMMTGGAIETANRYKLYTNTGGRQYYAIEESGCFSRMCCAPNHELTMHIHSVDRNGPELFRVHKPFKCCCAAVCGPCQKEITVSMMSGEEVGYVQQPCLGGCCTPTLDIYNKKEGGSRIAQLTGPCLLGSLCSTKFELRDESGLLIAEFEKKGVQNLEDFVKAMVSDADRFTMDFKQKTDVKLKATMIGTILFLDYLFFEGDQACGTTNPISGETSCICCNVYCIGMTIPCGCKFKPDKSGGS